MSLDRDLLIRAVGAADRFAAAERQAEMAKADYHHAIRQLHLAGATLREIADELRLSHQRVQQIVQASGGTWWSRVWRGRNVSADMTCSFCGLPPGEVSKLIAGPNVYICDACISVADEVLATQRPASTPRATIHAAAPHSRVVCSFCRRKRVPDLKLVGDDENYVCHKCLDLCRRILEARSQPAAAAAPQL